MHHTPSYFALPFKFVMVEKGMNFYSFAFVILSNTMFEN